MRAGWISWALCSLGVFSEAFVPGPLHVPTGGADRISTSATARFLAARGWAARPATPSARGGWAARSTVMQESTPEAGVEVKSNVLSSSSVELEEIAGQRLFVEFEAFGFYNRTCQLELQPDGDLIFSKGMITSENGAWRVEEEEGTEYLQFSCPLTELYTQVFDIPSALLFWRVPLLKAQDGAIVLEKGQIISEKKSLFGLKTDFIMEGGFKARVLGKDENFPLPDEIDISDIQIPDGIVARKKKSKKMSASTLAEEVAEPPLPTDLLG